MSTGTQKVKRKSERRLHAAHGRGLAEHGQGPGFNSQHRRKKVRLGH